MRSWVSGFHTLIILFAFILCGCQKIGVTIHSSSDSISGSINNFTSQSFSSPNTLASCVGQPVHLYSIDNNGKKQDLIETSSVTANGSYQFVGLRSKGVELTAPESTKYLLEFNCADTHYERFVTGTVDQNLGENTTLISWVTETSASDKVVAQDPSLWKDFYSALSNANTMTEAFSIINSNAELKNRFETTFGVNLDTLLHAPPKIQSITVPTSFQEGAGQAMIARAVHWSATYQQAISWRIGTQVLSASSNFNFAPGANMQGAHTVQLFIGHDNGSGQVDTSKPYIQKVFDIDIANTLPATPAPITRISSFYTNSTNVQLQLTTGTLVDGRPSQCHSFSNLAVTEEATPAIGSAPLLGSSYTIDCTQVPTQNISHSLAGAEGHRIVRLWAIDSSGNRSTNSSDVSVIYDITNPIVALTSHNGGSTIRGGDTQTISYTAADTNLASAPISIVYSFDNGSSWVSVASNIANTGSYSWTVPSINSSQVLLRVTAVDDATNSASAQSTATFTIDSTPPGAPAITRTSPAATSTATTTFEVQDCTDRSYIYSTIATSTPDGSEGGWTACATSTGYNVNVSGDGTHTVYVWAKDAAGNISASSSSYTMTLDQTGPTLALTSLTGGQKISGNTTQSPAINTKAVTWTASDVSGLATNPIAIEYSTDSGTNWTSSVSNLAHTGTYTWTVPNVNSATARVRVQACDIYNNCSYSASTSNLLIDSIAPTIASVIINDGAGYAGTAILGVKTNISDNFSGAGTLQLKLAAAHATTENCQSEFANSSWNTWTSATASATFLVAPVDGTKKVCAWSKDEAGNISVITDNSGAGSAGVDMDTIQFEVGTPPLAVSLQVSNNSGGANQGTSTYTSGEAVKIDWSISDVQGLHDQPFALAYTTDNTLWKDVVTNLTITDSNNVTWLGSLSGGPSSASGSYTSWTAPSSSYFRVRMVVRDNSGNFSVPALSQSQNSGNWSIFAGSKDRGDGGTGTSALLMGMDSTTSWFAIHPLTNDIYAADYGVGLRKLDVMTGKVSTVFIHGTTNLSDNGGSFPATPRVNIGTGVIVQFDSNGLLYIRPAGTNAIYQIDLAASTSKKYIGGGTDNGSLGSPSDIAIGDTTFTFDESNSMYLIVDCNPTTNPPTGVTEIYRLVKVTQDASTKAANGLSIFAGNCASNANPTVFPGDPVNSTIGSITYPRLSSIAAWGNGQYVYFNGYGSISLKVINGQLYQNAAPLSSFANLGYNNANGFLYGTSGGAAIRITPNLSGNLGEISTPVVGGATGAGCSDDDVAALSACISVGMMYKFDTSGTMYFADGSSSNSTAPYRIRYLTSDNKVRTIFGTKAFFGDGLDKSMIRGSFAGIHYKKSTDPSPVAFPPGLYFIEYQGCVLGHIDETTSLTNVIWGDQSRTAIPTEGTTISKAHSMGTPYSGGSCRPLAFDSNGLPWTRVGHYLTRLTTAKVLDYSLHGGSSWEAAPHGATNVNSTYFMYVYGGTHNLTMHNQGTFLLGSYIALPTIDRAARLTYFDTVANTATKVMGGVLKHSEGPFPSPPDLAAGAVFDTDIADACRTTGCKIQYVPIEDRLYYAEGSIMRYIDKPLDGAQSTLTTLFTAPGTISQFIVSEDQSQLWYYYGNTLRCFDISSGKSWCDNTTNHYPYSATLGALSSLPNTMTWKDSQTLLLSISDKIIQYNLPTGP